jgi:hypothetical protein
MTSSGKSHGAGGGHSLRGAGGGGSRHGAGGGGNLAGAGGGETHSATSPLVHTGHQYGYFGGYYGGYYGYVYVYPAVFANQTVSQALADFASNPTDAVISIVDAGAAVAGNLDALQHIAAAGELSTITLTDASPPVLAVTQAQLANDAGVLEHITSEFDLDITATAPNATIAGLGGHDEVILPGPSSQYNLTAAGDGSSLTATYNGAGGPGVYHISNVNYLQFADQTLFVVTADQANVARLYSAALGRQPDQPGLNYWEDIYAKDISAAAKANPTVALAQTNVPEIGNTIAGAFINSPEFQAHYGTLSDAAFVSQLYTNALGRAPDPGGLAYWENVLATDGSAGRAIVLVGFAESPENIAKAAHSWLFQV